MAGRGESLKRAGVLGMDVVWLGQDKALEPTGGAADGSRRQSRDDRLGRCLGAGEEVAGGVVRGEERRVSVLAEAFAEDVPTGSSSLESTPVQPLWKSWWRFLKKVKLKLPCMCVR